jgi:hypothetical protein
MTALMMVRAWQHLLTNLEPHDPKKDEWFNPAKGYGFIPPTGGGGRDVFVHISAYDVLSEPRVAT